MEFKAGYRVHVRMLLGVKTDFYATLRIFDEFRFELTDCSNILFNNFKVCRPNTEEYGLNGYHYYTLATDEEDAEPPVIQHISNMYNDVPTKYVVEVQGSYVNDIHLRGSTKMGGYWGSYTPDNEKLDIRNVWITDDYRKALGIAYLVNGEVQKFKE
ncbi:hypothetical protein [Mammaliicoccus sp. N-M50]|uniref:hypothetical protein n=1 Tax=Mammaliicoccus sp. N-M50 TaxID=2898709 RepID=UPI001EFAD41A|nr:hypothetical protein [Mammaliicoccus sp. N-M50]